MASALSLTVSPESFTTPYSVATYWIMVRGADTVLPGISTSLRLNDILSLLSFVGDYEIGLTATVPFEGYYINQEGGSYYVYCDTLVDNVSMLHKILYDEKDYEPSTYVKELSKYITKYAKRHP